MKTFFLDFFKIKAQFLHFDPHSEYGPDPDSVIKFNMARYERGACSPLSGAETVSTVIRTSGIRTKWDTYISRTVLQCYPRSGLDTS